MASLKFEVRGWPTSEPPKKAHNWMRVEGPFGPLLGPKGHGMPTRLKASK